MAGNKAYCLLPVNHFAKTIHHPHHPHQKELKTKVSVPNSTLDKTEDWKVENN